MEIDWEKVLRYDDISYRMAVKELAQGVPVCQLPLETVLQILHRAQILKDQFKAIDEFCELINTLMGKKDATEVLQDWDFEKDPGGYSIVDSLGSKRRREASANGD